jgi:glycosyltransferase involved in cell wall biosynthesis
MARLRERPWRAVSVMRFVLGARSALRRERGVARVIAHFAIPSAWPIASAARDARLEVVVHGSDARLLERLPGFVRRRVARVLESADVRSTSEELRDILRRALGSRVFSRTRVGVTPVDVKGTPGRAEARRALRVGDHERLVVVAGRLVRDKRVDVALSAARLAGASRLVVVGDGPERSTLERAFAEAEFTGLVPRNQALAWLSAADVLVSASEQEGSPSVVREARALGTPVVAVAAGDLASLSARDAGVWVVGRA